jgi:Ca2+/H+ antiporter
MLAGFMNFDKFVAPTLIKIVYWIGIVGVVLGALAMMATAAGRISYDAGSALGGILLAVIGAAVGVLVWRVICEIWIVLFSINDRMGVLVERGKI